jgi:hypothetical protein
MPYLHFDEAKDAAIAVARNWAGAQAPNVKIMLVVDLFGKLRLALWAGGDLDTAGISHELATGCGSWWADEVLQVDTLDPVTRQVYEAAWQASPSDDEGEPRLRVHDRHRSRTAWFAAPVDPLWAAPEAGPPVVVFYSFKGGLGRSTLLASFAIQRARLGERVCVLDFDLDSPGAGRLLAADAEGTTASWGVVDFLLERPSAEAQFSDYYHRCDRVSGSGEIVVFPAGRMDEHYADKLARVDLEEAPAGRADGIGKLLARVREEIRPRWILLDARTGISEPAGQLLSGIAHLHVLLGTTNDQSWQGLNRVLDRLGADRAAFDQPQAEVLLIQAMVPTGEPGKMAIERFAGRADEEFDRRFYMDDASDADTYWTVSDKESLDAPHNPVPIRYDSALADFVDIAEVAESLCGVAYREAGDRIASRFLSGETQ